MEHSLYPVVIVICVCYQVLERSISLQEDDSLLKAFIDFGDHCPKFLRPQLENVIELSLKVHRTVSKGAISKGSFER